MSSRFVRLLDHVQHTFQQQGMPFCNAKAKVFRPRVLCRVGEDAPKDACKYLQIEEFRCLNVTWMILDAQSIS